MSSLFGIDKCSVCGEAFAGAYEMCQDCRERLRPVDNKIDAAWTYSSDTKQVWDELSDKGIAENYGDEAQGWLLAASPLLLAACQLSEAYQEHVIEHRSTFGEMLMQFYNHQWDGKEPPANFVSRKRQEAIAASRGTP